MKLGSTALTRIALLGLATLGASCTTAGLGPTDPDRSVSSPPLILEQTVVEVDPCAGWSPILVSRDDDLTDGTAQAILAHNRYGELEGCW